MSTFTDRKKIAVPRKGRNAREALESELENSYFSWKVIGDMINGKGKEAAKTGDTAEIELELEQPGWKGVELAETDREGKRPVLEEIETLKDKIKGYSLEENPFTGYEEVWIPYDQAAELALRNGEGDDIPDLKESAKGYAEGYEVVEEVGNKISWAAMNCNLDEEPDVVLVPEKFRNLGEELASLYWESDFKVESYSGNVDEERELAQTPEDVAGVYMYDSGGTADSFGLDYDKIGEAESRLAKFQNRFKDNERTVEQEGY